MSAEVELKACRARLLNAELRIAGLKEALSWYADHRNYYARSGSGNTMLLDGGRKAVAALNSAKES